MRSYDDQSNKKYCVASMELANAISTLIEVGISADEIEDMVSDAISEAQETEADSTPRKRKPKK